jgi:hypothetical protein
MTLTADDLTRRPALTGLLVSIARQPGCTKRDAVTQRGTLIVPGATADRHYRLIGELIRGGLVEDRGGPSAFALHLTDDGLAVLARIVGFGEAP